MSKAMPQSTPPENPKLGFLGRLRTRSAKKRGQPLDRLDNAKLTTRGEVEARSSEKPTVTPPPPPKKKNPDTYRKRSKLPFWEEKVLTKPPSAREAAFGGPPRYDWIDIESAAAIKVQAAYRRNKVMADMEKQGLTTAAIRNRSRRRKAWRGENGTDDIPGLFRCCGIGLAFGDATEEDYEEKRQHDREQYLEQKKAKEQRELELRNRYRRKPKGDGEQEAFEVVEQAS